MSHSEITTTAGLLALFGTFFVVILIIALIGYFVQAFPLYKIAKNSGIENAWLAWIPVGNTYLFAKLGEPIPFELFNGSIRLSSRTNAFLIYIGISFGGGLLGSIPFIGPLVSFAAVVFALIIWWKFIKDFLDIYNSGSDNMVISVIATIIPIVYIVLLWVYMNRQPNYSQTFDTSYTNRTNNNGSNGYNNGQNNYNNGQNNYNNGQNNYNNGQNNYNNGQNNYNNGQNNYNNGQNNYNNQGNNNAQGNNPPQNNYNNNQGNN